jgi:hypothetical protein
MLKSQWSSCGAERVNHPQLEHVDDHLRSRSDDLRFPLIGLLSCGIRHVAAIADGLHFGKAAQGLNLALPSLVANVGNRRKQSRDLAVRATFRHVATCM